MPPPRESRTTNRIFVGRQEHKRVFEDAAFSIPSSGAIIRVFYGAGGQGKTELCREFIRKSDRTFDPSYAFLRRAHIDLKGRPKTDADLLLIWIRDSFAQAGVAFPCFDVALALMWEEKRSGLAFPKLTDPWLAKTSKVGDWSVNEAVEWLKSDNAKELLSDAAAEVPGVAFLMKHLGGWTIEKVKRGYLERTRPHLKRLYKDGELLPIYELSKLLPQMLAADLNHHLATNPTERFMLLVDEYEGVFDLGGVGARWLENPFDWNLREFVKYTDGLLIIFFAREQLNWAEETDWRVDFEGNQYLVEGLTYEQADSWLEAVTIQDGGVRDAIIQSARQDNVSPPSIYPLMVEMQIEHWRRHVGKGPVTPEYFSISASTFDDRRRRMVERLLRDYRDDGLQDTMQRLSVARKFDRPAFECIVKTFGTGVPLDRFDRISGLSLLTRSDGYLSFHNVIAAAVRETISDEMRVSSVQTLFDHYWQRAKVASHFELDNDKILALIEAAFFCRALQPSTYLTWLFGATSSLRDAAVFDVNKILWQEATVFSENAYGFEHPLTAYALDNLASILKDMGDYTAAKPLYERALEISEKCNGPEHALTGPYLNNLALLRQDMGDYSAAKALYERALAISEKINGAEHPSTGSCLNNLALLLQHMGDYAAAKPVYERALKIIEKADEPEHRSTSTCLNNLSMLLLLMGDYASAKPFLERALTISEKANGPMHPDTGTALNNLGMLLKETKEFTSAKPLLERALTISEKANGPKHPNMGACLNNLALLLHDMGDYVAAKPLFERALVIAEEADGAQHPNTGSCLNNLALLLHKMGGHVAAKPLFERALAISETANGPEHPRTMSTIDNFASLCLDMGDYAAAQPLLEKVLKISEKTWGEGHPSTAVALMKLAILLRERRKYAAAKPLMEKVLSINQKVNGPEHLTTSLTLSNLAVLLQDMGDNVGARRLLKRALAVSEKVNGPKHPSTVNCIIQLATVLARMGNHAAAKPYFERAAAILEPVLLPPRSEQPKPFLL